MSVTAARGFEASGVAAAIRKAGPDVALVRSIERAVGAAMWTRNRVQAAPVLVSRRHLERAEPQAVVVNSGIANAATGAEGERNAEATAAAVGAGLGLPPDEVIVLSTGVIGVQLPMDRLLDGVAAAAKALSEDGGAAAAEAILTTDTVAKEIAISRDGFTVGGMAKGAGMLHPALATMLVVITTDYPLDPGEVARFLRPPVEQTFNRISIDGDTSTNDAVVLLANGASRIARSTATDAAFAAVLTEVCAELARKIVDDGEGVTVLLEVAVAGASDDEQAMAIARRVATSALVKTAAFGRDPNWGRVLAAAGSAPWNGDYAELDPQTLTVSFNGNAVFAAGAPTGALPELDGTVCRIDLDLALGTGSASYLGCDLSYEYVRVNAEYTT
jgi:glutamate N-acetyltransferase / amino-acid N-acetyltransferase